ncbi:MAG: hypothetical protein IJP79_07190 [Paludibacteraceae bacterium]|nr:hypothetical protein [Paludibacteraceae bacterium]MBQ6963468.1 hypothetical protein [Paludibacteraceae bacterium]MBQ7662518.1 hypothetical protein [Prevotella sp.]MBQ7748257.1 hypothetical protein [Paludibacteraceae bacterium]
MWISFIIGVLLFVAYVVTAICLWGVPSSLSQTFYLLDGKPKGYIFTAAMWAVCFLIAPQWFSVTEDWATFSVFFAVGGLMLVGAAPMFKETDRGWHEVFAIICAVFALLWQILNGQYWEMALFLVVFCGIGIATKTYKSCRTFWLEMVAFGSTFLSIAMKGIGV